MKCRKRLPPREHSLPRRAEKDLRKPDSEIVPLLYGIEARFQVLNIGDNFYVNTDYQAPNHKILKVKLGQSPDQWQTIIPESKDVIEEATLVDGKFYVLRLHDVNGETTIYTLSGKPTGKISYPGIGVGTAVVGRPDQKDGFYSFQSLIGGHSAGISQTQLTEDYADEMAFLWPETGAATP